MIVQEDQTEFYTASKLLVRIRDMGLELPDDLWRLAIVRGLRYYDGANQYEDLISDPKYQISTNELSNLELGVALLSPDLPEESASKTQWCHRVGSAVVSSEGIDPEELTILAQQERCASILRWIATCGAEVEPKNSFWEVLLDTLPESEKPNRAPHPTRFFAMSGIARGKKKIRKQWLRL